MVWKANSREDRIQLGRDQPRDEQKQPPKLGAELTRCQIELPHIRNIGHRGPRALWAFLIQPPGEPREALFLEHARYGGGADGVAVIRECPTDVLHRQVLLAQGHHAITQPLPLTVRLGLSFRRQKELPFGVPAKLMGQHAKAAGGVAESLCDFHRGQSFDIIGS